MLASETSAASSGLDPFYRPHHLPPMQDNPGDQGSPAQSGSDQVAERRRLGLQKFKFASLVQIVLGIPTTVVAIATIVVASENIDLPVFNVFLLLTGILILIGGALGYYGAVKSLATSEVKKPFIVANFAITVANITFALLSTILAFISGGLCAAVDGDKSSADIFSKSCFPHVDANAGLAFTGAFLSIAIVVACIYDNILFCRFGRSFGFQGNRVQVVFLSKNGRPVVY